MSKYHKTRNRFRIEVPLHMWKSTSAWNMINRHWRRLSKMSNWRL